MKKNTAAFTDFLDKKYIPLEPKFKIIIAVVIIVIPIVAFYLAIYSPGTKTLTRLHNQKSSLETKLQNVRKKAQNREKMKQELAEVQAQFDEISALLPKDKEIPKILKDISALGTNAGLDFIAFKPGGDQPKDFYAEIPIDINVDGPYHSLGFFLDQVSKLDRIVTVNNIKMGSPKMDAGEMLLKSNCRLITYRFTNTPLQQDTNNNKKRRK